MSQPPILDLLRFLIADHSVDRGSASMLIPCLHESIEGDVDFLTAGARRCGGTAFNLNALDDHWEVPPGPLSADRLALVEGILASAADLLPSKVVIESTPNDDIVARLEDPDLVPEPSLVPVLRAAALIASAAYENFGLVVTTVDVTALDANRRELLWSLLTLDPADLRIAGEPTTIVPIIGKLVDPDIDYRRTPAIRYVVRWDRVLRRATQNDARSIQLFAKPSTEPIVLFLGAGASASSGLRLGNHYRDRALKELVGEQESSERAAEEFFDLLHERDHLQPGDGDSRAAFARDLTLERVLQEVFLELGYRPRTDAAVIQDIIADSESALQWLRSGRKAIRDLARILRGRLVIVTVNFDQLVETDLGIPTRVHYRPADFRDFRTELTAYLDGDSEAPIPILKIHGSIDDPSSIIATIDRTSAGLHDEVRETLNALLSHANSPLRWIWVGCSMRDRDVNFWLGGLAANALDEYWVDPLPGTPLDAFVESQRSSRWRALGLSLSDRLIIDSADGFLSAFARQVEGQS